MQKLQRFQVHSLVSELYVSLCHLPVPMGFSKVQRGSQLLPGRQGHQAEQQRCSVSLQLWCYKGYTVKMPSYSSAGLCAS